MASTVASEYASSSPKLVPSKSTSNSVLRRYVVSTRGIPRPVDKKTSEWLRPVSAPRSFRYETLATSVSLCNRRAETPTSVSASDVSCHGNEPPSAGNTVDDLTRTLETLEIAKSVFHEQLGSDVSGVLVDHTDVEQWSSSTAFAQFTTSVIPRESRVESVEKVDVSSKNDVTVNGDKKQSSLTRDDGGGRLAIQCMSDGLRPTTAHRSATLRGSDSKRLISPNHRLPVNNGLQRPLQRGRLFHGRPTQTHTPLSTVNTLALRPTSLSSRSLVAWSPNTSLSPTGQRPLRSIRSMSAGRNVVNTSSSRPLSLTWFPTHRSRAGTASVNVRPMVDPDVKVTEEDNFGLVVLGRSLKASNTSVGDEVTRHVTSSAMLALPPSLNYLLEVANQKSNYGGNERLAPPSGRVVNNSRSVMFDHVTSSSSVGRVDVRFDGSVTKATNGHVTVTSPRPPSAVHRSNGTVSPPGSNVGRSWCVTGGHGNWSPPRNGTTMATTHPATPMTSQMIQSQARLTPPTNGYHTAADLFSRSRLRRTGSSSSRSDRNSESEVNNEQVRYSRNTSQSDDGSSKQNETSDKVKVKSPVDWTTKVDEPGSRIFPSNEQSTSELNDTNLSESVLTSVVSSVSRDKPEVQNNTAVDELDVSHHVTLTNGPLGGAVVTMNIHSDPMTKEEVNESATIHKDGNHFLQVVKEEESRLNSLCSHSEADVNVTGLSDDVAGKIRAAIGKAQLLTTKKFKQFRELCLKNLTQDSDEPFPTTCQDLEGFWDLVMIQVENVNGLFEEIILLKQNNWKETRLQQLDDTLSSSPTWKSGNSPADPTNNRHSVTKSKLVSKKESTPSPSKSDAAKSREEARKRLLAAKAAGRQRKASEESDEVQIFIS